MKNLIRNIILFITFFAVVGQLAAQKKIIARQGNVSFFSYTAVEHITADNNQVLSIFDLSNNEIAISMLMNAFIFKKSLMREHFNESYIESDIYPKATFTGEVIDFDATSKLDQIKIVKGTFTMHGVSKKLELKTKIEYANGRYTMSGTYEDVVKDYNIKIPSLLAGNIADIITVDFKFEFQNYEN